MTSNYGVHALVVLLFVTWFGVADASSAPGRPIKRLAHPSTLALEILPRQDFTSPSTYYKRLSSPLHSNTLLHTDSFRLTISAFDEKFYLHLRPNEHLIHPSARINYFNTGPDGQNVLSHTEPLLRDSVKAYWGEVIPAHHSPSRMREDAARVHPQSTKTPELGWARIMIHHEGDVDEGIPPVFEGAFSVNGVVHHIMTKENYLRNKLELDPELISPPSNPDPRLVIWRDSDIMTPHEEQIARVGATVARPQVCGHDNLPYNTDPWLNPMLRKPVVNAWYDPFGVFDDTSLSNESVVKRDDVAGGGSGSNFESTINQTAGCPLSQKILYMGVASDCEYTTLYGSPQNATTQILNNWNTASALYKSTFNISLGIVELQVQNTSCPSTADPAVPWNVDCGSSITLNDRLSLFSGWRGQKGNDGAGLWHLMSGCPTGTEVGIAWLGTLCQQRSSGSTGSIVSGTAVSTGGRTEWQVVAHETGHNFGAIHDCQDGCTSSSPCCPLDGTTCNADAKFLMSPVAAPGETQFSQCSLGNICSLMLDTAQGQTNTTCLSDPDPTRQVISLQMCGNGIVEAGEDCDPGNGVNSTCCDTATCKFRTGAVCDPESSLCCTPQCTFAPSTQTCRSAKDDQCDVAEQCTGNSSACPADITSPNGKSCGSNGLACASGQCTSISKQCQMIGASMNLQNACPNQNQNSDCQVSCQDPTQANQCVILQAPLIDGSPCGYGGMCSSGKCQSGNLLDTVKAWYTQNLQISIPVTVVVGIIALAILFVIFRAVRRCCRARRTKSIYPVLAETRGQRPDSWSSVPIVPKQQPQPRSYDPPPFPPPPPPPPPPILRPGTMESFQRAPSVAHSSAAAREPPRRNLNGSRDTGVRARTQPFPSTPNQARSNWVDESYWNGPRPQ